MRWIKPTQNRLKYIAQRCLNHHLGTKTSKITFLLRVCTIVQAFSYRIVACGEPRQRMTKVCAFLFYDWNQCR